MVQQGERTGLALEAGQAFGVACESLRQDFDCDVALELGVPRAIDLAHPARANRRLDFVRTKSGTSLKGHGGRQIIRAVGARRRSAERTRASHSALYDEGHLDLHEAFIDGSFAPAKFALTFCATGQRFDAA
jgi:hypothetical protein